LLDGIAVGSWTENGAVISIINQDCISQIGDITFQVDGNKVRFAARTACGLMREMAHAEVSDASAADLAKQPIALVTSSMHIGYVFPILNSGRQHADSLL
jgi:hypothetical protein